MPDRKKRAQPCNFTCRQDHDPPEIAPRPTNRSRNNPSMASPPDLELGTPTSKMQPPLAKKVVYSKFHFHEQHSSLLQSRHPDPPAYRPWPISYQQYSFQDSNSIANNSPSTASSPSTIYTSDGLSLRTDSSDSDTPISRPSRQRRPDLFTCPLCKAPQSSLKRPTAFVEHVAQCHAQPLNCPRCHTVFETIDERRDHLRRETLCEVRSGPRVPGVTLDQLEELEGIAMGASLSCGRRKMPMTSMGRVWAQMQHVLRS